MRTESKTAQLITKLIRETAKGNVMWEVVDAPRALNAETEQSVPLYLQTEYKGKTLGVFDLRTKYFTDVDEWYWSEGVGFCIVDDRGRVVWESREASPALLDLFNTAREQASGIDDILDDLIGD
ncbi:hypothetical protein GCM10007891_09700 [Methylophaga thalassica]|uniref:Uncharacterized protein n=1 Tax=Methylophaga thalassica TaxID=40223 RepID=A0ABQ5TSF1_9GAMM|nr:hypothetical protein [Methylophaga thalassica]GLP99116.1 hypothetical protein GCM10007891_09700 [Methylophaga thalassica]